MLQTRREMWPHAISLSPYGVSVRSVKDWLEEKQSQEMPDMFSFFGDNDITFVIKR